MSDHSTLTGLELHQPWPYIQDADPGAVGAGLTWFSKASSTLKYRNDANTAWVTIIASSWAQPEIEILVPSGSDWDDFLAIYAAASAGSTIILANETILQTSVLLIDKDINILGHPGGASKILIQYNITHSGSAQQIQVGWTTSNINVKLSGFEIAHDRTAMGSTGRTTCINFGRDVASLEIDHMTFTDITSDCCHLWNTAGELDTYNVSFHDNVINEWYESIFLTLSGSCDGIRIYNNTGTTTARHPTGGISDPYGVDIGLENSYGNITNLVIANNSFTSTATTGNSLGIVMSTSPATGPVRYGPATIMGNTILGFNYNIAMRWLNSDSTTPSTVVVQQNTLSAGTYSLWIQEWAGGGNTPIVGTSTGHIKDALILLNNSVAPLLDAPTGFADNLYILNRNNG